MMRRRIYGAVLELTEILLALKVVAVALCKSAIALL
jgi:hypothetical protein